MLAVCYGEKSLFASCSMPSLAYPNATLFPMDQACKSYHPKHLGYSVAVQAWRRCLACALVGKGGGNGIGGSTERPQTWGISAPK